MPPEEPYIIEFYSLGNSVKVTAMDPKTLKEVSIVGAVNASRDELATVAVRKLRYMLSKGANEA